MKRSFEEGLGVSGRAAIGAATTRRASRTIRVLVAPVSGYMLDPRPLEARTDLTTVRTPTLVT
jgi:hypothetical protein